MRPTMKPPITGITMTNGPKGEPIGVALDTDTRPWKLTLVMSAMRLSRATAAPAAKIAMTIAVRLTEAMRCVADAGSRSVGLATSSGVMEGATDRRGA